jgi:gas vesicle protein
MAYAPGATATRKPSGASSGRPRTNGASKPRTVPPQSGRRPTVTFLAGLGIGLAVGAAAALLLAPRRGAETRQALSSRGRKIGNRARDAWEDLRVELEATRRALRRKRRDAKMEIEAEEHANENDNGNG